MKEVIEIGAEHGFQKSIAELISTVNLGTMRNVIGHSKVLRCEKCFKTCTLRKVNNYYLCENHFKEFDRDEKRTDD